ncbi:gene transfer agent family protein [Tardiphaga sp. 37S4]|uniref:gene transfer agent family protein n=1 Tax=Tardiphaga sp. 37S4 TaxID=1404741 RepID=UPI001E6565E3|nr:gene transfer agent family protein [Tardiphaga sp. 37S4]UFS77223.1 gene transfer agent family protein [Tardiphaga sp. 37S4]
MSGHGTIRLPFGNAEYDFNVAKHKQLFELQDKCGVSATGMDGEIIHIPSGPLEIFTRLRGGSWREADVVNAIRLGLIGGGTTVPETLKLMKEFVEDQPLGSLAPLAARILYACVYGVHGDELGKPAAEGAKSEAEDSTSSVPRSTEPAPE